MDTKLENYDLGLYVHIPFCHTKCTYCDFNTYSGIENLILDFQTAICSEIKFWQSEKPYLLSSIFIGGGTPSYLDINILEKIISTIKNTFIISDKAEITLEINPEDVTDEKSSSWKNIGINRCSVGIQSLQDNELKIINRRHDSDKAIKSLRILQNYFENISVDLIYGLPKQNLKSYINTLENIIEINPNHISSYSLQVEKGTFLDQQVSQKKITVADDDISAAMYKTTQNLLSEKRFKQYEISNWSRDGFNSEHNLKYWQLKPYIGVGPGAHSYLNKERFSIIKSPKKYIKTSKLLKQNNEVNFKEKINFLRSISFLDVYENYNKQNEILEFLMLSLRLEEGINILDFNKKFNLDFNTLYLDDLKEYLKDNILIKNKDCYKLSNKGKLFANEVASKFVK
ncbi:MAG: hypothetical protein CL773_02400 [Chloroflexi bacterium]|nr:hypothetical protein [Chloroflexota bacterium]|tara:strand:- start:541 stop:1740 length:1200 start_codon:yes stop_codon:yes gene_type:complete